MSARIELEDGAVYVVHTTCHTEDGAIRNLLRKVQHMGCIELRAIGAGKNIPEFSEYTEL